MCKNDLPCCCMFATSKIGLHMNGEITREIKPDENSVFRTSYLTLDLNAEKTYDSMKVNPDQKH